MRDAGTRPALPIQPLTARIKLSLVKGELLLGAALVALGRSVLDRFVEHGRCHCGSSEQAGPTRWREEDLARLLDGPQHPNGH